MLDAGIAGQGRMGRRQAEQPAQRIRGARLVAACKGEAAAPLTPADAAGAWRIGLAITKSLSSALVEAVQ
jgi:hypothetical protein